MRSHSIKNKTVHDRAPNSCTRDNLHGGLSEYQLSLLSHRACYYIQTGHSERVKVGSESVAAAAHVVCCVDRCPSCHHLLDRVHSLLHTGLQIPTRRVSDTFYRAIKAQPTPTVPHRAIDSTVAYSESLAYCATLGGAFDRVLLLLMLRSLITFRSDCGAASPVP